VVPADELQCDFLLVTSTSVFQSADAPGRRFSNVPTDAKPKTLAVIAKALTGGHIKSDRKILNKK
jgi:hypothetical protein